MTTPADTVEAYIAAFPAEIQARLRAIRAAARAAAPQAEERISYRMPALFEHGVLVYFAAFKHHIGLYPPVRDPKVRALVAAYAGPKGNLQFPHDQALPLELVTAVVQAHRRDRLARQGRR